MSEHVITEEDNGARIQVLSGQFITIKLNENPTTGYRWVKDEYDSEFIDIKSETFIRNTPEAVGSGGTKVIKILIKGVGESDISLKLLRKGKQNDSIIEQFKIYLESTK